VRALLWLVPTLPLAGFAILALSTGRLSPRLVALVGAGSVGLSALLAGLIAADFVLAPPLGHAYQQVLWTWMDLGDFAPRIGFYVDALAVVMMLVITGVGFLIHLYSIAFMRGDEGYSRFFAYMNLFVAAMLTLVLADNLLLLYLGWEGVGLCSYLLIGFWYGDAANGDAARKAFVVTRAGDTALLIALFILFTQLATLDIQLLLERAVLTWPAGTTVATVTALLLLGGAVGKSAQLPLQTWLPDAMAGPTPVSALIHAATMVTAGVYLIARLHVLFMLAPVAKTTVAVIGAATLLIAGLSALAQTDIKRVLAYSTISQIGYMFLALGVGAWSAAIFHLVTHAFFKALLFLAAGVVILRLHHEHDIFRMGGLRTRLPLAFWSFLIGAASLAALPMVTAGFYSKDLILLHAWSAPFGGTWLWLAGWLGALLTAVYIFRVVFIAFLGRAKTEASATRTSAAMSVPLVILAALALAGGVLDLPPALSERALLSTFLHAALPDTAPLPSSTEVVRTLQWLAVAASVGGIALAYALFGRGKGAPSPATWRRFLHAGLGFDWLYGWLFVRPYQALAARWRADPFDNIARATVDVSTIGHRALSRAQTGRVRWYAAAMTAGALVVIALALL
jgi:NADH-quinone oxidoreductase subunit L